MSNLVTIDVDSIYFDDWDGDTAKSFIAELQRMLDEVPLEYQNEVRLNVWGDSGGGRLYYMRNKYLSEIEKEESIARERDATLSTQEYQTYLRLKEKFEG